MSKEKVERYKQEKANRKEILAKEKRKKMLTRIGLWALAVVLVGSIGGAIGVTAYNRYEAYVASLPDYTSATRYMVNDLAGIRSNDAQDEETEDEDKNAQDAEDTKNEAEETEESGADSSDQESGEETEAE